MWFQILGPMRVSDQSGTRSVAGARQRTLLGALLAYANQPMPPERLAEIVWDGAPPAQAVPTLRTYMTRLRHSLGPEAAARIHTQDLGYLAEVGPTELDALAFETLSRDVGTAIRAGAWAEAAASASRSLALWQGTPLADVPSQVLRDAWLPHLEQQRLQVIEWRIEAELHLGHHERMVPQLRDLTARHPLREHFHSQLMLALARAGRQAEALAAYQDARRALVDQLAIEPGPELRRLHEAILAGDSGLLTPPPAAPRPQGTSQPRQLPAPVRHFVGRAGELTTLSELLTQQAEPGGAVVISAISGPAGIGKTALAVHWAHLYADRFPDGHLYVNLRGFDPAGAPMLAAEAVRRFLDALGVPGHRIPTDLDEQAVLYRSELAGRRMLIVLDNARDAGQVRPLLPGAPGSLVLATSRDRLAELVAIDGAVPLTLDLLSEQEARDLLARRLGGERLAAEGDAVDDLIQACARLPLALNIAAAHAALHPACALSQLTGGLRDADRCLDTLTIGSGAADIRAVFSWSYQTLDPQAARVFRFLGVHPGPDISLAAAASLAALDPGRARHALEALTRAHLITEHIPGRYTCHDLLRAYAAEQARIHHGEKGWHEALWRVLDFYIHTGYTADRLLRPYRPAIRLDPPALGTNPHPLADDPAAMAWFQAEHPNLIAALHIAVACHWHPAVWRLAWTLTTFHERRGLRHDDLAAWQAALDAAAHLRTPSARTIAHRFLGYAYALLGRREEAIEQLHQGLALTERHHDPTEQAHTHQALACAWGQLGDDGKALRQATLALDLYRTLDHSAWLANAHNIVGWYSARLGDYESARTHCQAAVAVHRQHNYPDGEAAALDSLGYAEHRAGHHDRAVAHYLSTLTLYRDLGNVYETANTLDNLGHPYAALGQHEQARVTWQRALELYQQQERTEDVERVQRQLDALNHLLTLPHPRDPARETRLRSGPEPSGGNPVVVIPMLSPPRGCHIHVVGRRCAAR